VSLASANTVFHSCSHFALLSTPCSYLSLPDPDEPPQLLKAFKRVRLSSLGDCKAVTFSLASRALSIFDVITDTWQVLRLPHSAPCPCLLALPCPCLCTLP